jgi:hypothetical protein
MGSTLNPRDCLREAISQNAEALAALHDTERTLARANEMLSALRAKRADFDSLDSEIATARADLVKAALDSADNEHLLMEEPPGFAVAKLTRDNLDAQIAGVRDSIAVMEAEVEAARRAAERTEYSLDVAREAVFCAEASALADEFTRRLSEVRHMAIRLRHMTLRQVRRSPEARNISGGQYFGQGATRALTMPKGVMEAVNEECMGSFDRKNHPSVRDRIALSVQDWWAALRTDANATLEDRAAAQADRLSRFDSVAFNEVESRL